MTKTDISETQDYESEKLSDTIHIRVPFYDVDSIQMVWHGNFVKYLEEGRESFGFKYGLEYLHIYNSGYLAPIADMHIEYKNTAGIGDTLIVETSYKPCRGAKLMFDYIVTRESDGELILKASTVQLFVTREGVFEVSTPGFYAEWKKKWETIIMKNENTD
jgi:Predicted thioesterase